MAKLNVYEYTIIIKVQIEFRLKLNMKPIQILIHFYFNYKAVSFILYIKYILHFQY